MFAQSSLGKDSIGFLAPGLTPQSTKILLSGVVKSIHERPTWPKPPSVNKDTSDLCTRRDLKIFSPTCLSCLLRSAEDILRL